MPYILKLGGNGSMSDCTVVFYLPVNSTVVISQQNSTYSCVGHCTRLKGFEVHKDTSLKNLVRQAEMDGLISIYLSFCH